MNTPLSALQCIYRAGCPNERLCQEAQRCCELHRPDTIPAARLVNSELREMPAIRLPTEAPSSNQCVWVRLPDIIHPLELAKVQMMRGCDNRVACGVHPIYPDDCPNCSKPVVLRPAAETKAESYIDAFLAMALPRIADLMQTDPEDGTPEGRELMLLADLADRYEKQKYPEFVGRPVRPHRSGGGGPPAREPPIEVLPRQKPNRDGQCREGFCSPNKPCVLPAGHLGPCAF